MHPTGIASAMSQLPNEAIALAAASHIERELQITPWNLSSNFVACTNQVTFCKIDEIYKRLLSFLFCSPGPGCTYLS